MEGRPPLVRNDRFSDVDWNLKGRKFRNGTWLCIKFNRANGAPCAQIH
jgi:hypothetical protein